jgi:hypothetical protein
MAWRWAIAITQELSAIIADHFNGIADYAIDTHPKHNTIIVFNFWAVSSNAIMELFTP